MASKTVVMLSDDFDGTEADESLDFGLDGVSYEIDLTSEHAEELRSLLAAYIDAGRRTGGRKHVGAPSGVKGSAPRATVPGQAHTIDPADRVALKRFAAENGYKVPADRGRIARELVTLWEEAGKPA